MTLVDAANFLLDNETTIKKDEDGAVSKTTDSYPINTELDATIKESARVSVTSTPIKSFVELLMDLLDDDTNSNVVAWMPDGKSFTLVNPKHFVSVEMPKIFEIKNMSSFVRKLTRWGFTRGFDKSTMNSDIFQHKDFQKGRREDLKKINCSVGPPTLRSSFAVADRGKALATVSADAQVAQKPPDVNAARPSFKTSLHATVGARFASPPTRPIVATVTSATDIDASKSFLHQPRSNSERDILSRRVSMEGFSDPYRGYDMAGNLTPLHGASRSFLASPAPILAPPALESIPRGGVPPPLPSSSMRHVGNVAGLSTAIESLLRERENLIKGAEANALALMTLIHEQERRRTIQEGGGRGGTEHPHHGRVGVASSQTPPPTSPPPARGHGIRGTFLPLPVVGSREYGNYGHSPLLPLGRARHPLN